MHLSRSQLDQSEKKFRIRLMNSVTGFKSANLIGTKDQDGNANVAVFSTVTHFGSNPPVIGVTFRPPNEYHQTYSNIKATDFYTINVIHTEIIEQAHKTSGNFEREINEFEVTGLSEWYSPSLPDIPYVQESKIKIGMKYLEEHKIKVNGTILVIGEVQEIFVDDSLLQKDGLIDHQKSKTATISGLDCYFSGKLEKRLAQQ